MSFLKRPTSVIGLDVGASSVKAVEIQSKPNSFEVTGFGQIEVEPDDAAATKEAVETLLKEGGFQARRLATAINGKMVIVRHLQMEKAQDDKLAEAVKFEAEKYLPFPLEDAIVDYQQTGEQENGDLDVLLVAAKRDQVEAHLSRVSGAGLKPELIDLDAFAISNAFEYCGGFDRSENSDAVLAFVDVGAAKTTINIVSGRSTRFTREVSIGGTEFTETLGRILNMPFDEAEEYKREPGEGEAVLEEALSPPIEELANEIQLSFEWFQNQYQLRVDRVLISGGGARLPFFKRVFSDVLDLPVEDFDPFAAFAVDEGLDAELLQSSAPQLVVAAGLAARLVRS